MSTKPLFIVVHHDGMVNPLSVTVLTELKAKGNNITVMGTPLLRKDAFDALSDHAFPIFDGKLQDFGRPESALFLRIPCADSRVPEEFRGMEWCFMISPTVGVHPANLVQCAEDIQKSVSELGLGQTPKVQSAVRHPVFVSRTASPEGNRVSSNN